MFECKFETINSAFDDNDGRTETARILRAIADSIEQRGSNGRPITDTNGNRIGEFWFENEDDEADDSEKE